jgi:hypothetical protein
MRSPYGGRMITAVTTPPPHRTAPHRTAPHRTAPHRTDESEPDIAGATTVAETNPLWLKAGSGRYGSLAAPPGAATHP